MQLHWIDIGIIVLYFIATIFVGFWVSKRASRDMKSYFLGGNTLPWYMLGVSNAFGYFWGMFVGIVSAVALASPRLLPDLHDIYKFPIILVVSLIAALLGTFLTKPEDDEVLMESYRRVRPWGFWGPVYRKILKEDPAFLKNKDFFRDMFNIGVGTVWQCCFVLLAMYLVTRNFLNALLTFAVGVATTLILNKNWYDRLPRPETEAAPQERPAEARTVAQ